MLEFRKPQLSDKNWIDNALQDSGRMGSEACFGNLFMWCDAYDCTVAEKNGTLLCKARNSFTYPVGGADPDAVFRDLAEYYSSENKQLNLHGLCDEQVKKIENDYPGKFIFSQDRDSSDYIYSVSELATLSGKKYHGKRNHISFFEKTFDWTYEEMTVDSAKECLDFSTYWMKTNKDKIELGADDEYIAIEKALKYFDELGFRGGILRVQGDIVAYTFGEQISDRLFCTHVEKAVSDIRGAYPMINREFARHTINDYELVNREEDLGIPGLRKAKESYKPELLLTKYTAVSAKENLV